MLIRAAQPADVPGIARVVVDSWRTTYRGIIPDAVLDDLSYEERARIWAQAIDNPASVVYVAATPAGEIVGAATGGPAPAEYSDYQGELQAIYLLAAHQGQGLGRRLLAAVAQQLAERDLFSLLVWVLAENPACRFYEALGGQPAGARPFAIGGVTLTLLAYGWADTRPLYA
jgi:GNAT superfamily N-acetyltransferase